MLFCISNNNFIMIIHLTMSILHWVLMMIILELLSLWMKKRDLMFLVLSYWRLEVVNVKKLMQIWQFFKRTCLVWVMNNCTCNELHDIFFCKLCLNQQTKFELQRYTVEISFGLQPLFMVQIQAAYNNF